MAKTATIKLDGVEYTIHAFNFREMQRLAKLLAGPRDDSGIDILRLVLERADPKPPDVETIEFEGGMPELQAAVAAIMKLAGFASQPADPQLAAPPAA